MDKTCTTILDYLISKGGCEYICYFLDNDFEKTCHELSLPVENARAAVRYLNNEGFIDYIKARKSNCTFGFQLSYKGLNYKTFIKETEAQQPATSNIFNIQNVSHSAFGNAGITIINNGISFEEIQDFINSQDIPKADKELLIAATEIVKTHIENDIPMKKGFLHRFGDLFNKYGETFTKIMLAIGTKFFISPPQ